MKAVLLELKLNNLHRTVPIKAVIFRDELEIFFVT